MKLSLSTEWLLFHLWKNNPETGQSCPGIIIPDTVIYRWAQPYFWYYTSNDGTLIRKTKDRVNIDEINQTFHDNLKNDIQNHKKTIGEKFMESNFEDKVIATYMTSQPCKDGKNSVERIDFEHFQQRNFCKFHYLENFLYQRDKMLSAIIQRFIPPYRDKNHMIKVIWTPQFTLCERRTNKNLIFDDNKTLKNRLVTFDGDDHLCVQDPIVSPTIQADLENICTNIVKHIQEVSGGNIQISKMVLFMKMDQSDRLQLLFSTELKIREKYTFQIEPLREKDAQKRTQSPIMRQVDHQKKYFVYKQINLTNAQGQLQPYNGENCLYQIKELFDLKFRYIIDSFDQQLMTNRDFEIMNPVNENDQENIPNYATTLQQHGLSYKLPFLSDQEQKSQNNNHVPKFLEYVWGKITLDQYKKLKKNTSWCNLTTKVCDTCYFNFTLCTIGDENDIQVKNQKIQKYDKVQSRLNQQTFRQKQQLIDNISKKNQTISQIQNQTQSNNTQFSLNISTRQSLKFVPETERNLNANQQRYNQYKLEQIQYNQTLNTTRAQCIDKKFRFDQFNDDFQKSRHKNRKFFNIVTDQQNIHNVYIKQNIINKLPKLNIKQNSLINTTQSTDGSQINDHNKIVQTIKELKNHLLDF